MMNPKSLWKMSWKSWFNRDNMVHNLELFQDFIIISLCIGLFCVMLIRLGEMYLSLLKPLNFQLITSDILFILILVELFRLLIIYLKERRISVGAAVEVSLVSALREVILQGVLDISVDRLLSACAFLGVLGGLLFLRVWMFQRFDMVKQARMEELADNLHSQAHQLSSAEQYPF